MKNWEERKTGRDARKSAAVEGGIATLFSQLNCQWDMLVVSPGTRRRLALPVEERRAEQVGVWSRVM